LPRLLYVGDYGKTGFGTVANGLLTGLHARGWEILHLAINYNDLEPATTPWKMVPAGFFVPSTNDGKTFSYEETDPFGYLKVDRWIESFDPDIVLLNNDFPVVARYMNRDNKMTAFAQHRSKKVIYAPMDSFPFPYPFYQSAILFDQVVAYSYWQKDMMAVADVDKFADVPVVYHGVDTGTYFPIPKNEAKAQLIEVFQKYNKGATIPDFRNAFLVYFVGTNQWRKDLPALFRGYVELRKQFPEDRMFLIPHTNAVPMSPTHGGWSLYNLRVLTDLKDAVLMQQANIFNEEEMNIFYNAADVLAYPTKGEGFGLPSLEAMATKTPVLATRFGPQYEIHADRRGYFIDVDDFEPGNVSAVTYFARPSWRSLGERLGHIFTHPEEREQIAERAYEWVQRQTWDAKAGEMHEILLGVLNRPVIEVRPNRAERRAKKKKHASLV